MSTVKIFEFIIDSLSIVAIYVFIVLGYMLIMRLDEILKEKDEIVRDLERENGFYKGVLKGLIENSEDGEDVEKK